MTLLSVFCFLAALFILLSCLRRGADIFSPARVFGLVWAIAIGLADLKLSRLQHQWDSFSWITLLLGVGSFLVGILTINVLFLEKKMISLDAIRSRIHGSRISEPKLFLIIILLFVAYFSSYIIEWFHYGALPLFAPHPDRARSDIGLFGFHLFVNAMPTMAFLCIQYFLFVKRKMAKTILIGAIFLIAFVSYFVLLNRLPYVFFLILTLSFAFYTTRLVRLRNVVLLGAIFVIMLAYLQALRETRYAEHFLYVISDMKYSSTFAALTGPYMYIVMNLENFARAVVRVEHFTFGYFTFDFVMALTGLKHWLANYFGLEERIFLVSGYNTFPFFWDYYYDFGLAGIAVLPALLGGGIALLHRWVRQQPTFLNTALYSVAVFTMVMSFFTNLLTSLGFMFDIGVLFVAQIIITANGINHRMRL